MALYEIDHGPRAEDVGNARLQNPPEAVADPSARLRWGLDRQAPGDELAGAQWLEPDAIGRLANSP